MLDWLLRKLFKHKELGWEEHGEIFTRFELLRTPWFKLYLHRLYAPNFLPTSHNHPWDFRTLLLWDGYWEQMECGKVFWRRVGSLLYRPAETKHNIKTNGWSWSLVFSTHKRRDWSFGHCRGQEPEKPLVAATHK